MDPLRLGDVVRLKPFWGHYAGPQYATVVDTYPDALVVKVEPPLGGVAWWSPYELRRTRRVATLAKLARGST